MSADTRQALAALIRAYVRLMETGRDRIFAAGGQCDSLEDMERSDPFLRDARAALSAQPVAGAVALWMPIETAPKDGKDVLVYTDNGLVRLAFFDTARGGVWSSWPGRNEYQPTHWMRLPTAPQAQAAPAPEPSAQAVAHPSHQTVREWMPVSEALRLSDLWTAGDLDNCGQWRAAIKVLADEVRALAASPQPEPSAQGEPVACDRDAPVCPWCDRQGLDICQHADDARTCGK